MSLKGTWYVYFKKSTCGKRAGFAAAATGLMGLFPGWKMHIRNRPSLLQVLRGHERWRSLETDITTLITFRVAPSLDKVFKS